MRLAVVGAAAMAGAGFLGGHLAYRKGWVDQTVFRGWVADWTRVLDEQELADTKARRVSAGGTDILLYRRTHRIFALANRGSHRGGRCTRGASATGVSAAPGI